MSKFSNVIRTANSVPRFPFTINRQSEQSRGLGGWWPLIGRGNYVIDMTSRQTPGSLADASVVTWEGGPIGDALRFTNSSFSSYVTLGTTAGIIQDNTSATFAFWYRKTDATLRANVFLCGNTGSTGTDRVWIHHTYSDGTTYWDWGNNSSGRLSVATPAATGWEHWAFVVGASWQAIYRNGAAIASRSSSVTLTPTGDMRIGAATDGGHKPDEVQASDFRYYSRALSASEVWALYDPATRYELYQPLSRRVYGIPTASADQTAILPLLEAANSLYAPTVVPAALTLTLPRIEATESIYSPTVSAGAVTAVLPAISADGAAYAPTVAPGTVTETLPLIGAAGELYAPTVVEAGTTAVLPQLAANGAFYSPTIIFDQTLALPQLAAAGALYAPSVVENLAAGIRVTLSNAPVLNLTLADASVLTLTASDDLAEG